MSWLAAAPAVVLAAFWAIGPGLLCGYAWGLRGVTAWGAAPLLSVAVAAISAVLASAVGLPWGLWVPLLAAVLVALAALGVRVAGDVLLPKYRTRPETTLASLRDRVRAAYVRLRTPRGQFARLPDAVDAAPTTAVRITSWPAAAVREGRAAVRDGRAAVRDGRAAVRDGRAAVREGRAAVRDGRDGRRTGLAAAVGLTLAAVLGWLSAVNGMGTADALSQTYDAVFHYSAVAHVMGTGDGSSLTLGTVTAPMSTTAFYPAAWHDLVSLTTLSTGAGVIASTNATALVVAVVIWPLGCLFLARQVLGPSAGVAVAAPVLAVGFTAFPWNLMTFGVLWPNLLGVALLPAALAATATLLGLARDSVLGWRGATALLVVGVPTLALAHPNAVFSLGVLALSPLLWWLVGLFRRRLRGPTWWQPVVALVVTAGVVSFGTWLVTASPLTAGVRSFDWKAFETAGESVWAVLTNSTNGRPDSWTISVLVLVGAVVALRRSTTSWLVPAHIASGFLYLQAASQESGFTEAVTGAWYNDSYRLAAMVPVTGAALATVGVVGIAGLVRQGLLARTPTASARRRALPALTAVAVTLVAVLVSGGMHGQVHATVLSGPYRMPADVLLEPGQREFLERVGQEVPPDAVVAQNPYAGNALLYPLTGREVLFPHMSGAWTPQMVTIAARLRYASFEPGVCDAVAATRVDYVISGPVTFWPWDGRSTHYPGLDGLDGFPGFEPIDTDGRNTLYRVTACDTIDIAYS